MMGCDISTANGIFDALKAIQIQCEQRAEGARDAGNQDRADDWALLACNIEDAMEGLEHLHD